MTALPAELWSRVFSFLSIAGESSNSNPDTWAKIVTGNVIRRKDPNGLVSECNATKCAISLVSKSFYELSRPIALECITLRNVAPFRCLSQMLKKKPRHADILGRCTKRLDVRIDTEQSTLEVSEAQSIVQNFFTDLKSIFDLCSNLTYFTCQLYGDTVYETGDIVSHFVNTRPSLEVLRWRFISPTNVELSSLFSKFDSIRVLDLSYTEDVMPVTVNAYGLPYLHTLIGLVEIICPNFLDVQLPSLRTVICKPKVKREYVPTKLPFFRRHGRKIESLELTIETANHDILNELFPEVKELILEVSEPGYFDLFWLNVRHLAIVGRVTEDGKLAEMLLYTLGRINTLKQRGNYPRLQTIRILGVRSVRLLREGYRSRTKVCEKQLRGWNIRLEDSSGDLILPPPRLKLWRPRSRNLDGTLRY